MLSLNETDSLAVYAAAFRGFGRPWRSGFDVALWPDGDARPIASGCAAQAGGMPVLENVSESDFGDDWNCEDYDEATFADMCLVCHGCVELSEDRYID